MNDHQRVITTRWWISYFALPSIPPNKTTNESQRLVGGFLPPSALDSNQNNPTIPLCPHPWPKRPPTSLNDSLVAFHLGIGRGFVTCRGRGKGSPGVRVGVGNFVPSKNPYPQCGLRVFGGFFGGYEIQRKCDFILIFLYFYNK